MLKQWLRRYEARRLNRDAVAVIEADAYTHGEEHLTAIARQVDTLLKQVAPGSVDRARTMQVLKNSHRKARDERNQIDLSAATLAIIYVRARELGEATRPARDAIERFAAQYCGIACGDDWSREW